MCLLLALFLLDYVLLLLYTTNRSKQKQTKKMEEGDHHPSSD
jgi:hypothetical protein